MKKNGQTVLIDYVIGVRRQTGGAVASGPG